MNELGRFLELLYDVLFHPGSALRVIATERKVGYSLGAFLISILIPLWAVVFGLKTAGISAAVSIVVLIQIIGSLLLWVVGSAVFGLIAEFFGGRGTAMGLLAGIGFAHVPRIFIVPLLVVSSVLPEVIQTMFIALSGIVVVFWTLALHAIAVREAYDLSLARAVLVLGTPLLAVVVFFLVMLVFAGSILFQWLPQL